MSKIINEIKDVLKTEEIKVIPDTPKEIMIRYLQLRKLAISYWDIFSYSLGYCLIFPIIHRIQQRNKLGRLNFPIISSFFFAYIFYKHSLKYFTRMFNKQDYQNFKLFCKKYNLEENTLF